MSRYIYKTFTGYRDSREAFANAIAKGVFEAPDKRGTPAGRHLMSISYADQYMYMHTQNGVDYFKHIDTRQYVTCSM